MKQPPPAVPGTAPAGKPPMLLRFVPLLAFGAAGLVLAAKLAFDLPQAGPLESEPTPWYLFWWKVVGFLLISLPASAVVLARSTRFIDVGVDDRGRLKRKAINAPGAAYALIGMGLQALALLILLLLIAFAAGVF